MKSPHRSRGAASFRFRLFSWILYTALVVPALLLAAPAGLARAQAGDPGLSWTLEALLPPGPGGGEIGALAGEAARLELENALAARLGDPGVQVRVEPSGRLDGAFLASLSGSGGVQQLRAALFTGLRGQASFPADGAELLIHAPAVRGQALTLVLNGNISTGFRWDWDALDPAQLTLAGEPQSQTTGGPGRLGAPQIITAELRAAADGELAARLVYRQPWREGQAPQVRLSIQAGSLPPVLDLSDPAIGSRVQMPLAQAGPLLPAPVDAQALPASFDWRAQGKVTPVRNQGNCGSCWAFSVVGVLESAVKVQLGAPDGDLSEQYLVNCNGYSYGCNGGWFTAHNLHQNAFIAPQTAAGSVTEAQLRYTAQDGACAANYQKGYRLTEWRFINYETPNVAAIKQAILDYGPVGTAVCVGPAFYAYGGGVFATDESCGSDFVNHAVILVGWDDSTQSWIMKNSWGAGWAEDGYMRIRYGTSEIGSYANYVSVQAGAPLLTAPAAGAVTADFTPDFSWQPVGGAQGYQIQVAAEDTFAAPLADAGLSGATYTLPEALAPNSQFFWRVRAQLGSGSTSWSAARALKTLPSVPAPAGPSGGETVVSLRPTLTWTQAGTAGKYEVQISDRADFGALKFVGSSTGLSWKPGSDLPRNAGLFWRVRAVGSYGNSAWSSPGAAFTTLDPPQPPALSAPASGAVIRPDGHPVFTWKKPAVSIPEGYHIQFSRTSSFTEIAAEADVTGATSYTFGDVFEGNRLFYWRVASFNGNPRMTSAYTAARSLKVLPDVPLGLAPAGVRVDSLRPTLRWEAAANNPRYDVQVSKLATCGSPFKSATVSKPELALTSSLPKLATIYWRVRSRGAYGLSAWSACRSFTTPDPPSVPALVSPASGSTLPSGAPFQPVFVWKVSTNKPDGYILQLSPGSSINLAAAIDTEIADPAQTRLTWPEQLPYGIYAWRMRAYRGAGAERVYSVWSAARTFKTQPGLQGRVTETLTGLPVAGAMVSVYGLGLSSVTDGNGQYRFASVPAGSRKLIFSASGYAALAKTVSITAGGLRTADVQVKKLPGQ